MRSPVTTKTTSNDFGRDWALHERFSSTAGRDDPLGCMARPSWRGRVHMLGLFAAIPAVVAYNRYSHDIDRLAIRFESFIEEFSNILQRQAH